MTGFLKCALAAGLLLLAACSPAAPSSAPAPAAGSKPAASSASQAAAPAPAAPAQAAAPSAWQQLVDAAKREGRVVVSGPGFPGLRNGLVEGFQQAHGIPLEYLGLPPSEIITRVDRETRTGRPSIDVNLGGFTACWAMAERDQLEDIGPLLVAPEVLDPAAWRGGKLKYIEPSPTMPKEFRCGLQTAEWVMTDLFVNRDLIPPGSITSWKDLLKPEYKGKIASFDPRPAGPAQTTVPYLSRLFGVDYLRDLYIDQQVTLTTDNRQLAEWVARGNYPIGIALVQAAIETFKGQGLPLERVYPTDGPGALTSGFGSAMKIKNGPNPNAAALFVNWLASKDGQEMWEREMLEMSRRADVAHRVPEYVIPRPGVEYAVDATDPEQYFGYGARAREALQGWLGR